MENGLRASIDACEQAQTLARQRSRVLTARAQSIRGFCMSVDAATVKRVAHLARIKIDDERSAVMAEELSKILGWVEMLGEVNTDGVEPLAAVIPNTLRWREDVVTDGGIQDKVLSNAPKAEYGFFAVPKVIE